MEGDIHQGIRYCAQHLINMLQSLTLNILREKFPRNQNICWLKSKENKIKMKPRWEVPNASELEAYVERKGGSLPRKSGLVLEGTPPVLNFHMQTRIPEAARGNLNSCFWPHWLESLERVLEHWSLTKAAQGIPVYIRVNRVLMEKVALIYMRIVQSFPFWMDEDLFSQNSLSLRVLAKVLH